MKNCIFRFYWQRQGGHIHCRVFSGPANDQTFAKCGDLVFQREEWAEARAKLERIGSMKEDSE